VRRPTSRIAGRRPDEEWFYRRGAGPSRWLQVVGDPAAAVEFEESPEGHALRYDARGHLVGVTIVNAGWLLEQDEQVTITLPKPMQVDRDALAAAIGPRD
jgi:hypothetical protein